MARKTDQKMLRQIARDLGNIRNKRIGFAVTFVTLILCFAIIISIASPDRAGIKVGDLALETITAPEDITDTVTTQALISSAENSVQPVYVVSDDKQTQNINEVHLFFSRLENARSFAEETYVRIFNESVSKRNQIDMLDVLPSEVDWASVLNESDQQTICSLATLVYSTDTALKVAALTAEEIATANKKVDLILSSQNFSREILLNETAYKQTIKNEVEVNYFFSATILEMANHAIDNYVAPFIWVDTEKTDSLINEAVSAVQPVVYKQGQNIAVKGEVITEAQYAILESLDLVNTRNVSAELYISLFLFLGVVFFGFYVLMAIFELAYFKRIKQSLILALIMILAVAVMTLSETYQSEVMVVIFATIMCTVLVGRRTALSFNLALALVFASIIVWQKGQVSALDFERIILVITTGSAVPLLLKNASHRSSIIQASIGAGFVGVVTILSLGLLRSLNMHDLIMRSLWCLFSCPVNGIFAIGLLPMWEMIFGMATQTKLLELSNSNRKLLQRLMQEAPGTFYHSGMVANLAERAAEALGANSLLVRAAALYHDIGKLENPQYFTENKGEGNPHEGLTNIESAKIIIGHVEASVRMTRADNIPRDVIEIISQHHGDALLPNFYFNEKEKTPNVDEELFRYPFSKPTTKEAGILMIADTVEAAMRSMGDLPPDERRDKINALVVEKFNHGLLDDCPLTRKELGVCAQIFTISLENAQHKRVKYKYNLSGQVQE